ncbi:RNA polymerase III RPC4-domain-containing protein [Pterulicium gracile]|uniref:RNA polymerase III RPC4-domain-containing protein n=1 Tax=Pterulicium gracile TaxID=1884261 RepID=A0A5C3QJ97_9AGAR|nr:RNA polymerase III RPC4-domain-containing protein [Pterula gracilis]
MSGEPSGSSGAGAGTPGPSKGIGNLAKRPETTRQGTQKLKFVPTLPQRKKKATEVKEEAPAPTLPPADSGRGRGRGDGRGRGAGEGRGRGRGAPRQEVEMTASGPFALGPALAGRSGSSRPAPKSNFAIPTPGGTGPSTIGQRAPHVKKEPTAGSLEKGKGKEKEEPQDDEEVYSDADEGVEIIDMDQVRHTDWMAPESLRREKKKRIKAKKIKVKEDPANSEKPLDSLAEVEVDVDAAVASGELDLANAIDLSEEEEEEEMEDIIDDFSQNAFDMATDIRQEKIYLFQFPSPFPAFTSPSVEASADVEPTEPKPLSKKVSFSADTKSATPDASGTPSEPPPAKPVDGSIGQLEIYESGAVKMRLANNILLDVTSGTQSSFLQQATFVDMDQHRLVVLGEVTKRFVVSPDVDNLLQMMEEAEQKSSGGIGGEGGLISMDVDT